MSDRERPSRRGGVARNITATVLSHNSADTLEDVLTALGVQTLAPARVIVVDNASTDGTAEFLAKAEEVEVVSLPENEGVGAGHNRAIELALTDPDCEYVWVLEHDSVPTATCLFEMMRAVERCSHNSVIGAVMPRRARRSEVGANLRGSNLESGVILTFNGCLLPRSTYETVGRIREDFFVGLEDSEYSDRIQSSGLYVYHAPGGLLFHENKGMRRRGVKPSVFRTYYSIRNSAFLEIHLRRRPGSVLMALVRGLGGSVRSLLTEDQKVSRIAARLVGTYDGVVGRLGRRGYWFL